MTSNVDGTTRVMRALADLVDSRRQTLGKSYRKLADEAGVSIATVHKIAQGKLTRVPSPKTMAGLARALEVPEQSLIAAATTDLGLQEFVIEEGDRRSIYLATELLSAKERATVLAVINGFLAAHEGDGE